MVAEAFFLLEDKVEKKNKVTKVVKVVRVTKVGWWMGEGVYDFDAF